MTLARRDTRLRELMDDPDCDPVRLRRTLERFRVVNRLVAGWDGVYRDLIRPLVRPGETLRILDIGCGGGDVLERVSALARANGARVDALGIDPDARSLAVAEARGGSAAYRLAHSSDLVAEGARFDVVLSNHVLHHLDAAALQTVLADSDALAESLVVHSDIARSRRAYAAYTVAITPIAPGSFLRTDGLRSIRRSFTADELAPLLPAGWRAVRRAPFRLLAVRP